MRHSEIDHWLGSRPASTPVIWAAAGAMVIVAGLIGGPILLATDWAVDGAYNLSAAAEFAQGGDIYADGRFLYPPLAAILLRPLTLIDPSVALAIMAACNLGLVAAAAAVMAHAQPAPARALAIGAAVAFLPVLHDTILGNTNVIIAASIFWATRRGDRPIRGIPFGLVLAAVPKPWALPFLIWMVICRPRAAAAAIMVATLSTGFTAILVGIEQYWAWIGNVLSAGTFIDGPFNAGLSAISPVLALIVGGAAGLAAALCAARNRDLGLAAAAGAGVLASPYLGLYGGVPLLLAVSPLASRAPYVAGLLVVIAAVAVAFALPAVAACVVILAVTLSRGPVKLESRA